MAWEALLDNQGKEGEVDLVHLDIPEVEVVGNLVARWVVAQAEVDLQTSA